MSSSTSPRVLRALAVSLIFIPLLSGCVSKGKYESVVEERDALVQRNIALRGLAAGLGNEIMLRDREIEQLEIEQQELTDEVVRWAVRGAIEMQMLADGLHLVLPHDVLIDTGTTDLSAEGKEIINFSVGEPDFSTPEFVTEAAIEALKDGWTRYTATPGVPEAPPNAPTVISTRRRSFAFATAT